MIKIFKQSCIAVAVASSILTTQASFAFESSEVEKTINKLSADIGFSDIISYDYTDTSMGKDVFAVRDVAVGYRVDAGLFPDTKPSPVLLVDKLAFKGVDIEHFSQYQGSTIGLSVNNLRFSENASNSLKMWLDYLDRTNVSKDHEKTLDSDAFLYFFIESMSIGGSEADFLSHIAPFLKTVINTNIDLTVELDVGNYEVRWDDERNREPMPVGLERVYIPAKLKVEAAMDGVIKANLISDVSIHMLTMSELGQERKSKLSDPIDMLSVLLKSSELYGEQISLRVEDNGLKDSVNEDKNHPLRSLISMANGELVKVNAMFSTQISEYQDKLKKEPGDNNYLYLLREAEAQKKYAVLVGDFINNLKGFEINVVMGDKDYCYNRLGYRCNLDLKEIPATVHKSLVGVKGYTHIKAELNSL